MKLLHWDHRFTWSAIAVCLLWWNIKVLGTGTVTSYTATVWHRTCCHPHTAQIIFLSFYFHFLPEVSLEAVSSTSRVLILLCFPYLLSFMPFCEMIRTSRTLSNAFPRSHQQYFSKPLWQPTRGDIWRPAVWHWDGLSCLLHQHPAALHLRGLHYR